MKRTAKNIIAKSLTYFDYPILINSYGRSGSTILTKSIVKSAVIKNKSPIPKIASRSLYQEIWNLSDYSLKDGIVYKTHDYPSQREVKENIRMIYTFANPVDVVLSLIRLYEERGEKWMKNHYKHLKAEYTSFNGIITEDQLQLEKHLNAWLQVEQFPIAFVKYETMWEYQDELSEFLGFKVKLPEYRKRKAGYDINKELTSEISKTHRSLIKKINALKPFFTNQEMIL